MVMETGYLTSPSAGANSEAGDTFLSGHDEVGIGFRVAGLRCLITTRIHCEVVEHPQVSPLPNVAPWFNGLLNLHGNVVPVFDLRLLLGQAASNQAKSQLLAIDKGEKTVAVWIDGYPEMLNGFSASPEPLPALPELLRHGVAGTVLCNGDVWLNFDPAKLFKAIGGKNPQQIISEETVP